MGDEEFPPLLAAGFHPVTLEHLKTLTVENFPLSKKRGDRWKSLMFIFNWLIELELPCDIWVDGSFLTQKIEPSDIDLAFAFPIEAFESATPQQKEVIEKLAERFYKKSEKLDTHVFFTCPPDHPEAVVQSLAQEQWEDIFGHELYTRNPKGIAVLTVKP